MFDHFQRLVESGALERIHDALFERERRRQGRHAEPTLAIVDAQAVAGAPKGGASVDASGYDAAKRVRGRKRHAVVDASELLIAAVVTEASVQDFRGAGPVLAEARRRRPTVQRVLGDQLYSGPVVRDAMAAISDEWSFEAVRRPRGQKGFVVLKRRWVIERTFAWLSRCRRMARDFERFHRTSRAMNHLAMIRLMLRRLARPDVAIPQPQRA